MRFQAGLGEFVFLLRRSGGFPLGVLEMNRDLLPETFRDGPNDLIIDRKPATFLPRGGSTALNAMHQSTLDFNKEIFVGECGALLVANLAAVTVSHFTHNAGTISGFAVGGTLLGGTLFWLGVRIYDQNRQHRFEAKTLASDIGYFTPAALVFGFLVYDPSIFFTSRHFLVRGDRVWYSVAVGQLVAFSLFLFCMNLYRLVLFKFKGKRL